jgi:Lon protease-like protein
MAVTFKEGLADLRQALKHESDIQHASTQNMVSELQSLFRTELQTSAMRSLEDSEMTARGEMDIQLFKGVMEDGNKELMSVIKKVIHEVQSQAWQARVENSVDIAPIVEQTGNRTVKAVIEAISELSARQEVIGQVASARERDATVERLITELTPVLSSLQSEPIDYEFLTNQLTQAVKPHISQLIDLASDKRETASLIVDSIIPLLPSRQSLSLDTDALILQLTAEVRRAIAPIDAFEIKEQVADLVVERLDSRLAVRDKAFNADNISGKIMDGVSRLLDPIQGFTTSIDNVAASQEFLSSQHSELASSHSHLFKVMSDLPLKFAAGVEALNETKADLLSKLAQPTVVVSESDENILNVKAIVEGIEQGQKGLVAQTDDLRTIHHQILDKLNSFPDAFHATANALQDRHDEALSTLNATQREMDEIRKLNSDLQIQLTKARGAHGQVRVEKDALSERIGVVEGERDRLRGQVNELEISNAGATAQVTTLEARTLDLEEALAQALARLQASDVVTQANQERINELEEINRESASENQALKSKVSLTTLST